MKIIFAIILPVITVIGCNGGTKPVLSDGVEKCEGACIVLEHFNCPEAKQDCIPKCRKIASIPYLWNDDTSGPLCLIKAETIQNVRDCNVKCKQ